MKLNWQKLTSRLAYWLFAEIMLNLIGMDDLADYGEYVFEHIIDQPTIAIISTNSYPSNPFHSTVLTPKINYVN